MVIGEKLNLASRVKRGGKRVQCDAGRTYVSWNESGQIKSFAIPDWFIKSNELYAGGNVEHLKLACRLGMRGVPEAQAYLEWQARRQLEAGVSCLDLSVDGLDGTPEESKRVMAWLVQTVQRVAGAVPLALNSLDPAVVRAGLQAYDFGRSRPLVNGVMSHNAELLDIAEEWEVSFVWFVDDMFGMPHSVAERVQNLSTLLGQARKRGLDLARIYFDLLVYPKVASAREGRDVLGAFAAARKLADGRLRTIGGVSNFWMPAGHPLRQLVSLVFLDLMIASGASGAVLDPLTCHPSMLGKLDRNADCYKRTAEMILSEDDELVMRFLGDARDGVIEDPFAKK